MLSDPDADVRRMAADALGVLAQNTRDPRVLSLLLSRIDDSAEEWHVRDTAYDAIQKALGQIPDYARLGKPMTWPDDARPDVMVEARVIAENSTCQVRPQNLDQLFSVPPLLRVIPFSP